MSFLSRFATIAKDGPTRTSSRSASASGSHIDVKQGLLPLTLPSSSLLADSPLKPRPRLQQQLRPAVDPARDKRERVRLEKARLTPGEVTLLIDECSTVIRSRGLATLGLFRPFRASESRPVIRALCLGFLDYVSECAARPTALDDSRGTEASKAVFLHAFRGELRYAGVHDVVAVLKWGLRHLAFPPGTSFSGPSPPSFSWYTTFLARTTPTSPPHAFSAFLVPSLPPPSQALLLSALSLIQAVAAHAQENAMPAHRLCRLFAAYLFGLSPSTAPSFDKAQQQWRDAGAALEGCLSAFLAGQTDLPPRLAELVDPHAVPVEDRTVRVLRVELETRGEWDAAGTEDVNDQATGRVAVAGDRPVRRKPFEVLRAAVEAGALPAEADGDAAVEAWAALVALATARDSAEGGDAETLLDEETIRVLDLVGLGAAGEPDNRPFALLSSGADGRSRTEKPPASWDAFASSGFAPAPSAEFGLLSQSQLLSRAEALALEAQRARPTPASRLVGVRLADVDDAFADAWLDSLDETCSPASPCAAWPSIVLAPLQRSAAARAGPGVEHLLVVEMLLPLPPRARAPPRQPEQQQHPGLRRAPSSAHSRTASADGALTAGRRWRRRASAIFSPSSASLDESVPREDEHDTSGAIGALLPAVRRSRKSLGRATPPAQDLAPPVPPLRGAGGSGPSTFVRSLSQGFASARRKASRQSMYGAGAGGTGGLASPTEESETAPAPAPTLPEKVSTPRGAQQLQLDDDDDNEVRGYDVVTPQGSPVIDRARAFAGAREEDEPARPGMPPLGCVAVPSAVVEEPELPSDGERAGLEREMLHAPASVDPLTGSPTHLDSIPLAPLNAAPFANLAAVECVAEPLAAAGVPQLERAAELDDPAAVIETRDAPVEHAERADTVLHNNAPLFEETDASAVPPPLPQKPETANLPAATEAEELVAPAEPDAQMQPESQIDAVEPLAAQPDVPSRTAHTASLAVEQGETLEPGTPTSPLVTLSPPPPEEETKEVPVTPERHAREGAADVERQPVEEEEAPRPAPLGVAMGLGLVNTPIQPGEPEPAAPATPRKDDPHPHSHSRAADPQTPHTFASPSLSVDAAHSPALSQGSQPSFRMPKSPTPSSSSTGSRRFLASVGGFLKRKKSAVEKDQARQDKADAVREKEEQKQLRKLREEELRREIKERKAPTPVSNVKARVREIEEEHGAAGAAPASPMTPSRVRPASSTTSPRPGTPTRIASRHPSATSLRALSDTSVVPPPDQPLPALPADSDVVDPLVHADSAAQLQVEAPEAAAYHDVSPNTVDKLSMLLGYEGAAEDERAGSIRLPAQESQHLHVKLPSSLDDLPTPVPSPTPQAMDAAPAEPLPTSDDDQTTPIPNLVQPVFAAAAPDIVGKQMDEECVDADADEDHTVVLSPIDVSAPVPAQSPEHLHFKVPSSVADLLSATPSPTPHRDEDTDDALSEDVTQGIAELCPPVFAPAGLAGLASSAAGADDDVVPRTHEENVEHGAEAEQIMPDSELVGAGVAESAPLDRHVQPNEPAASELPVTPSKRATAVQNGTPLARERVDAPPALDDVFSAAPPVSAIDATPTKPAPAPRPHVIRGSTSQQSLSTTRSFETADSSAQSSTTTTDEHWEGTF
ncbi:hypothetical protein JCM3770_002666 [Rhodotorula araucariae]